MSITILAAGSRGDVQPGAARGAALRRAGRAVRLASHAQIAGQARASAVADAPAARRSAAVGQIIAAEGGVGRAEALVAETFSRGRQAAPRMAEA